MNDGDNLFMGLLCAGIVCVLVILVDGWFYRPQARSGRDQHGGAMAAEDWRAMRWWCWRSRCCGGCFATKRSISVSCWWWSAPFPACIWVLDQAFFARRRKLAAAAAGTPAERVREPIAVEYARSFFPVIVLVLVIRSFLFEPFRIPSDSMMPTLFDGDFIFVSKYSYGLRLPVTNTLLVATGTPQRGDVIVFRLPPNPKINYIKRLVGLPGDRIRVDENNQLYVNDKPMPQDAGTHLHRTQAGHVELRGAPTAFERWVTSATASCFPPATPKPANGWCPPATISSWATIAITARTADLLDDSRGAGLRTGAESSG